jgi:hypothetical protein
MAFCDTLAPVHPVTQMASASTTTPVIEPSEGWLQCRMERRGIVGVRRAMDFLNEMWSAAQANCSP